MVFEGPLKMDPNLTTSHKPNSCCFLPLKILSHCYYQLGLNESLYCSFGQLDKTFKVKQKIVVNWVYMPAKHSCHNNFFFFKLGNTSNWTFLEGKHFWRLSFWGLYRTNLCELNFLGTKKFPDLILELNLDFWYTVGFGSSWFSKFENLSCFNCQKSDPCFAQLK